jgi:hypothetical protein
MKKLHLLQRLVALSRGQAYTTLDDTVVSPSSISELVRLPTLITSPVGATDKLQFFSLSEDGFVTWASEIPVVPSTTSQPLKTQRKPVHAA